MHCLTPPVPLMSALRRAVLSIDEAKALHRSVLGRGIGPGAGCTVVARTWIRSSGSGEETDVDESAEDGLLDGPSDSFARLRRPGAGGHDHTYRECRPVGPDVRRVWRPGRP